MPNVSTFFKNALNNYKKEKIIIYPNLYGFILGFFVFFCFLISIFYENNFALLINIIIFFIFFISIIISNQNLSNIDLIINDENLIEAENLGFINIILQNYSKNKKVNLEIFIDDLIYKKINLDKGKNIISIEVPKSNRGVKNLDKVTLRSNFPFGIINTKRVFKESNNIYFYPKIITSSLDFNLNKFLLDEKSQEEFDGIDKYEIGDSLSKIAWKKTSSANEKFVKQFKNSENYTNNFLDLEDYKHINFEDLLGIVTKIIFNSYKNKINFSVKYKKDILIIDGQKSSLNKSLKYLSQIAI